MAPRSCTTCQSPCVNTLVDPAGELDELAGQGPARRSNVGSNEAPTPPEASIPPLVPPTSKDLFTKFMKVFMETTQAQAQALVEPQQRSLKARTSKTYSGKSHMGCYHFCQQCEDYFKTSGATEMNRIVEKPTSCYPICWKAFPPSSLSSSYHLPICWETTFLDLILLGI